MPVIVLTALKLLTAVWTLIAPHLPELEADFTALKNKIEGNASAPTAAQTIAAAEDALNTTISTVVDVSTGGQQNTGKAVQGAVQTVETIVNEIVNPAVSKATS